MEIVISQISPDHPDAVSLISELDATLAPLYPVESQHGLSVERLMVEKVDFFLLFVNKQPAACGGIKTYLDYAEVKRMYVRPNYRKLGLARTLPAHLERHALGLGLSVLRLETGIHQLDAIALYERLDYYKIYPFGEYKEDPLNLFYEKKIR